MSFKLLIFCSDVRSNSIKFYLPIRRSQRTDWHKERKLNSETFGVASARRGAFRGRGYYGGRGFNRQQGMFRPRGQPRNDRNNGQTEGKQQNTAEETSESQKNVPVQAAGEGGI